MQNNAKDTELIKSIGKRTQLRKTMKDMYDRAISLSSVESNADDEIVTKQYKMDVTAKLEDVDGKYVRLLDEGMVVYSDGSPYFYIKRGAIEKYMANLADDFVGHIDLGHMDYAIYPKPLGTWTKKDLKVVDIGDNRKALDVRLNLDERLSDVQDLKVLGLPVGVSVEMNTKTDWEETEKTYKDGGHGYEVVESIDIFGFGIVGDAGNVNSGGIILKNEGGTEMSEEKKTILDGLKKFLNIKEEKPVEQKKELKAETEEEKLMLAATEKMEEQAEEIKTLKAASDTKDADLEEAKKLMVGAQKTLEAQEATIKELTEENKALKAAGKKEQSKALSAAQKLQKFLGNCEVEEEDRSFTEEEAEEMTKVLAAQDVITENEDITDGIG